MNKLLITGFLICCSMKGFSTCIAIYLAENGRIYVAADSRRTLFFKEGKDKNKFETICKIHHVGANYFAIAGIDDGGLLRAATEALQQSANIDTAIRSFETAMVKRYDQLMTDTRKYYPDKFKHFLNNGLADVSFFGFSNGEPYVVDIEFLFYLDKNDRVVTTYRMQRITDLNIVGISKDIINAEPKDLPTKETMKQNPQLYVESLVKIEAKKQPDAVSAPIDLLELSANGPVWIRKNENAVAY